MSGKLIIFSAPSGSGKTTIVNCIKDKYALRFSVSATTRSPRNGEVQGKDYLFLSLKEFKTNIDQNQFLEYEEVYPNKFYGTLKSEVETTLQAGFNVVFDVDVVGGLAIKKYYKEKALSIFIQAPSIEELEKRLKHRGTDTSETIRERVAKAAYELTFASQFDVIVVNKHLDSAIKEVEKHVDTFLGS